MPDQEEKKKRFWVVDPSIFKHGPKDSRLRRFIIYPAKSLTKFFLYGLMFAYPLYLVILGILFGGLVFWGTLAGSMVIIGLLLWKTGYAKNFQAWNPSLGRQLIGLSLAFLLTLGFYIGLITQMVWMIPAIIVVAVLGVIVLLRSNPF